MVSRPSFFLRPRTVFKYEAVEFTAKWDPGNKAGRIMIAKLIVALMLLCAVLITSAFGQALLSKRLEEHRRIN